MACLSKSKLQLVDTRLPFGQPLCEQSLTFGEGKMNRTGQTDFVVRPYGVPVGVGDA